MKNRKRGFTLIELLVVVLIIGILAAVALPQYQTAVKKSRIARYFPLLATLAAAEEVYYMENGVYSPYSDDLSVALPAGTLAGTSNDNGWITLPDGTTIDLLNGSDYLAGGDNKSHIFLTSSDNVRLRFYLEHSLYPGVRFCSGDEKVCKSLGAQTEWGGGWIME